ncbi:claudin-3-like [Pristis pectinata]|uniref:claudin-3-like n=1 Tax=Pristis pectinata TaxID=685728 RepID=UPI00223CFE2D|nr:claudin-3-like [Pristis pectinata]
MASVALEIVGLLLSVSGLVCALLSCALPLWKVPAFQGGNMVTALQTWEGLWMDCVWQSTGELVCSTFDSVLILSGQLQAARALTTTAAALAAVGILLTIPGAGWTTLIRWLTCKVRITSAAGFIFLLTGVLQLVPVSTTASGIVSDFYSESTPEQAKKELGPSLYLGMAAGILFIAGGCSLWVSCYMRRGQDTCPVLYTPGHADAIQSQYV